MKKKSNPKNPSEKKLSLRPPELLSPRLEADIQAYLEKKKAAGFSDNAALALAHKHFINAINRDIKTNPETRKRVLRYARKKELASYKWYVRILLKTFPFFRFFQAKKPSS